MPFRLRYLFLSLLISLLFTGSAATALADTALPAVSLMRTPDNGIQPQVAVDSTGVVHLIYFKGDPAAGDLFYVRREATEQRFSEPVQVNSYPGSAVAMGTIRGAQLAVGKAGRVHVVWNGSKKAQPRADSPSHDTPMLYTRLNDAGDAFEPQRNLIDYAVGLDGGGSVAADGQGNVYVAWHANPAADGEANRRVYLAISTDDGQNFASEVPVSKPGTGVCACCGMKAQVDNDGRLLLLYRSATDTFHRDTYLLSSSDAGHTFSSHRIDQWHIATCPMSSATFAVGASTFVAGWEAAERVCFAWMDRIGAPLDIIRPAGPAKGQKHPSAAINERGQVILVWAEGTGWKRGGSLAWRIYDHQGRPLGPPNDRQGVPVWSFASVFADGKDGFTILY